MVLCSHASVHLWHLHFLYGVTRSDQSVKFAVNALCARPLEIRAQGATPELPKLPHLSCAICRVEYLTGPQHAFVGRKMYFFHSQPKQTSYTSTCMSTGLHLLLNQTLKSEWGEAWPPKQGEGSVASSVC